MRTAWQRSCLTLLLLSFVITTTAATAADLKDLEWLSGAWVLTKGNRTVEERWMSPSGGLMVGMGRTVSGGKTMEFEFLRIEQRGDDLFYVAQPNGIPPTEFKLVKCSATEVVFENLKHDFPQRVAYVRNEDGSVTARIEGPGKQGTKVISFEYKRAK